MSEWSEAEDHLISLLDVRTAGDPDDEDIIFTDLSPATLADRMAALGTLVCRARFGTGWMRTTFGYERSASVWLAANRRIVMPSLYGEALRGHPGLLENST
jgi:hypothetical protein